MQHQFVIYKTSGQFVKRTLRETSSQNSVEMTDKQETLVKNILDPSCFLGNHLSKVQKNS